MKTLFSFVLPNPNRPEEVLVGTYKVFNDGEAVVFPKVREVITVNKDSEPTEVIIGSIIKRYENEFKAEYSLNVQRVI